MSKTLHYNQLLSSALISGTHSSCLPITIHEPDHPQDLALIQDHEIWQIREQEYAVGAYNSPSSPPTIFPEDLDFLDYPPVQLPPATPFLSDTPLRDSDIAFDLSLAESCLSSWEVPGTCPAMHQTAYVHVSSHDVHDESGHNDARDYFPGSRCAESSVLSSQHWSNGRSSTEEEPTSSPANSPSRNVDPLKEKGSLKGVLRTKSISQPLKPKPQALKRKCMANIWKPSASSGRPSDRIKESIASTAKPQPINKRVYGSKTLVSERIRRIKLNEKLLSLRALVPRISKMDKASIVADAIDYVKDLHKQLRSTQNDILAIQAGTYVATQERLSSDASKAVHARPHKQANNPQHKIIEMHLWNVNPKMFHLCIHCEREWGVLLHLTKALEALYLKIVSANLTSITDRVINTIIIKVDKVLKVEDLKELLEKIFPMYGLHF